MTSPDDSANDIMAEIMANMGYTDELFRQDIADTQNVLDDLIDGSIENFRSGAEAPAVYAAVNMALMLLGAGEVVALLAADITFRAQERMLKDEIDGLSEA